MSAPPAGEPVLEPAREPAAESKELLRFLTCGSVDDGKSTLIGRVLYDGGLVAEDQLAQLAAESRRFGTTGDDIDVSLLLDGLDDERQQRITIDVAYRFFATPQRAFIVADAPGHEQYTRNMATGASTADLAVILVDARQGILPQTRRHSFICSLLGIREIVLAINKMDLVGYDRAVFDRIVEGYAAASRDLKFSHVQPIPLSALKGDNVVRRSAAMPWYDGESFLEYLEAVPVAGGKSEQPFRMPVQWVNRPNAEFRGFSGTVVSGSVAPGDSILVAGTGRSCRVREIVTFDGKLARAGAGDAVTLALDEEIDISRGDLLSDPKSPPEFADQFAAHVLWMSEAPLLAGRPYLMKIGTRAVAATVTTIRHRVDIETFAHDAASTLALNEIGVCNLATTSPVAFDAYAINRDTGAFILIDRFTNETAGVGMIEFGLRRATNIHWQALAVSAAERAALKRQSPAILWFTGLSGAGKSTIANLVEQKLFGEGLHTMLLDGDNVRHGLNRDLGFTDAGRVENIRRIGEVARLMNEAGLIVLCSFISPFRAERRMVRELPGAGTFIEVFVDTPIEECVRRDPKGLYAKASSGRLQNFTGIDSPYEPPENPELRLETLDTSPDRQAELVVEYLRARKII